MCAQAARNPTDHGSRQRINLEAAIQLKTVDWMMIVSGCSGCPNSTGT
jgi:hypothetical protein